MQLCRGDFEETERTQYVVISGWDEILENAVRRYHDDTTSEPRKAYVTQFMQPLGVYDTLEEAVGRAYCFLTECYISDDADDSEHKPYISNLYKLGDDQGYGMGIKFIDESYEPTTYDWCYILYLETYKKRGADGHLQE